MKLALAILFAFSIRAEVIQLGTICRGTGIDIIYPDRLDIVSLEITFLKPGTGVTNLATITTTNRLLQLADIPAEIPDGRTILAMRWITLGGLKSAYRMATMDLYRNPPDAPIARSTFISTGVLLPEKESDTVGVSGKETTVPQTRSFQVQTLTRPPSSTNDAPVRAWHGAMVDPDLARAVADHFRKPTDPPPPMPPAFYTPEQATRKAETPAQRAQRMFFEQGGQKGRKK